jgi:hypothetical protein
MSTAFYPTNMRRQSAGGYSNNSTLENIPYVPWKGTGLFSNPIGVTATHIRPLTNMDPGNVFPTGFGLPRPIKHYRKGTVIPINFKVLTLDPTNPGQYIEKNLIEYNVNRAVKSSIASSLGGGSGGTGIISQMIDMPGSFIVKDNGTTLNNTLDENGIKPEVEAGGLNIDAECKSCNGVGIVSDWYPINNLSEKPQPNVTNPLLCCSQQRKAMRRVLPSNTNINKKYFQTTYMYLYNRCQTFKQRQFNFIAGIIDPKVIDIIAQYPFVGRSILEYTKPGDPLSNLIYYVAQCNPNFTIERGAQIAFIGLLSQSLLSAGFISQENYNNIIESMSIQDFLNNLKGILNNEQYAVLVAYLYQLSTNPNNTALITGPTNPKGCSQVYYKPNNPQYATQGGVSSSTRILKLNVDTISTAAARQRKLRGATAASSLASGNIPYTPFIYKDKVPQCQKQTYIGNPFFFQGQHQNKLLCTTRTNGSEYQTYNSVNGGSAGNYIGSTQQGGGR